MMLKVGGLLRTATSKITRNFSTLKVNNGISHKGILRVNPLNTGKRCMSGHGPDISKFQAAMYILIGGGGFAAFGMYQTKCMRDRIERFETGKLIAFKTVSDEVVQEYKEKYRQLNDDDEENEEVEEVDQEPESSESSQQEQVAEEEQVSEPNSSDEQANNESEKPSKDTIIFIEAPKE